MSRSRKAWGGIDPGKQGALCILEENGGLSFLDWPKSNTVHEVRDYLYEVESYLNLKGVVLEKVNTFFRKGGAMGTFNFGRNYGNWESLLICLEIPFLALTPAAWRTGLVTKKDGPDPKQANLNVALKMFPQASKLVHGPKGALKDGRVDSLLMAHVARERLK